MGTWGKSEALMEQKSPPRGWCCLAWHLLPRVSPAPWDVPWEGEVGAGQALCHPKQGLKCQSHSSQVGTSSCEPKGRISVFWKDESEKFGFDSPWVPLRGEVTMAFISFF